MPDSPNTSSGPGAGTGTAGPRPGTGATPIPTFMLPPPPPLVSIILNEPEAPVPNVIPIPKILANKSLSISDSELVMKTNKLSNSHSPGAGAGGFLGNDLMSVRSEFRLQKSTLLPEDRGRPMIDWIRKQRTFQNEMDDRTSEIGPDELKLHHKRSDCWIALRGRVYDITSYVSFHPGGVPEIMKGAGIDGTALFNSIHRYVNFEQILKGKQVGIYVPDKIGVREHVSSSNGEIQLDSTPVIEVEKNSDNLALLPKTKFSEDDKTIYYKVEMKGYRNSEDNWTAGIIAHEFLVLKVFTTPPEMWIAQFKLREKLIQDRIELKFSSCAKKGCVKFSKPKALEWKTIGESLSPSNVIEDSRRTVDNMHDCKIVERKEIAHNMYYFLIELPQSVRIGVPVGSDVKFCIQDSRRKYTPICRLFSNSKNSSSNPTNHQYIHFIIKVYEDGELTPKLRDLPIGENNTLTIGNPASVFNTDFLHGSKTYFLFAGGSGITPYFRIIQYYLDHNVALGVDHIVLLYWSREEREVVHKSDFENLAKKTPWFYFYPILTQEKSTSWKGHRGRISVELMNSLFKQLKLATAKNKKSMRFLTCGTDGFNCSVSDTLETLGFSPESIFVFLG